MGKAKGRLLSDGTIFPLVSVLARRVPSVVVPLVTKRMAVVTEELPLRIGARLRGKVRTPADTR
jgi:hypothetical protein